MTDDDGATLEILAVDEPADDQSKGIFGGKTPSVSVQRVSVAVLRRNMRATVASLRDLFDEVAAENGMPLKQAQVQLEVTASGGVTLVGTGQLASKGAITLTFEPRPAAPTAP